MLPNVCMHMQCEKYRYMRLLSYFIIHSNKIMDYPNIFFHCEAISPPYYFLFIDFKAYYVIHFHNLSSPLELYLKLLLSFIPFLSLSMHVTIPNISYIFIFIFISYVNYFFFFYQYFV